MSASIRQLFDLHGKVALIIGGAHHLGYDIATALAEAGSDLIITSRSISSAIQSAEALSGAFKVEVLPMELDHRRYGAVAEAIGRAKDWKGRIDILVNNAGGGSGKSRAHILDRDPREVEDLIAVNLTGVLHCCQAVGKIMCAQRQGKIISLASIAALVGRDRRIYERNGLNGQPIDYAAAKAGVLGMTRDLAAALSPWGICVNAISPGGFERDDMPRGFVRDYSDRTPLGRMGKDGVDIKGAALFLASSASDYVTGQNLVVDGGFSLWR